MLGTKVAEHLTSDELLTQIQRAHRTSGTKEVPADHFSTL